MQPACRGLGGAPGGQGPQSTAKGSESPTPITQACLSQDRGPESQPRGPTRGTLKTCPLTGM